MSRKIFTKVFSGSLSITGAVPTSLPADKTWLMQEDIEVVGAEAVIAIQAPSENDGSAFAAVELSQVGVQSMDGQLLEAKATEGWNTTPAGIDQTSQAVVVMFPAGYTVPVKEEGYLYINGYGLGKAAGTAIFPYKVIVYYIKRGA